MTQTLPVTMSIKLSKIKSTKLIFATFVHCLRVLILLKKRKNKQNKTKENKG